MGVPEPLELDRPTEYAVGSYFLRGCYDRCLASWRTAARALVGGSAISFITLALAQSVLVIWGAVRWPFINSVPYLGIIAAMGYELSYDFLRAAKLAQDFQASEAALRGKRSAH